MGLGDLILSKVCQFFQRCFTDVRNVIQVALKWLFLLQKVSEVIYYLSQTSVASGGWELCLQTLVYAIQTNFSFELKLTNILVTRLVIRMVLKYISKIKQLKLSWEPK